MTTGSRQAVMPPSEFSPWFQGKEFAFDWASYNFANWAAVLKPLAAWPAIRILEIGSYEGVSAIFFLNFFPQASITCIDPWDPATMEPALVALDQAGSEQYQFAEGRFDRNMRQFSDRVHKIKATDVEALPQLAFDRERFNLIYVDGSHRSKTAFIDCTLSWPLLNPAGFMIMDDYEFAVPIAEELKPKRGVDTFLMTIAGQYGEITRGYQIIIRRKPWVIS